MLRGASPPSEALASCALLFSSPAARPFESEQQGVAQVGPVTGGVDSQERPRHSKVHFPLVEEACYQALFANIAAAAVGLCYRLCAVDTRFGRLVLADCLFCKLGWRPARVSDHTQRLSASLSPAFADRHFSRYGGHERREVALF